MSAIQTFTADASSLADTVERARALLDDGDVLAARMLSAAAYEQAKGLGKVAERFGAAERLVEKAKRLQGDALLIETRAKIRIAIEWDAAQESGEASTGGRPKTVPDGNGFTAGEAGLTRKDIHEARKLAAAEAKEPGIVERAIATRIEGGLAPSRANLRAAVGTHTATKEERGNNLYETGPEAIGTLLALERFGPRVLEPSCGRGAIVRPLEDAGYTVLLSDLIDYGTTSADGECQFVRDFLKLDAIDGCPDIVTNPPYGEVLNAYVARALRVHRPRKMALLMNLNFLCGFDDPNRNFAMEECPPARVLVFKRRLPMMHRDDYYGPEAASRMNTAWFVWELQPDGSYGSQTVVRRVDWKDHAATPALPPQLGWVPPQGSIDWDWQADGLCSAWVGTVDIGCISQMDDGWCWEIKPEGRDVVLASGLSKRDGAARLAFTAAWRRICEGVTPETVPA